MMNMAPLRGTVITYCALPDSKVMIQKDNYKYTTIDLDLFNHLYLELNSSRAALKEDCIEYTVYYHDKPLFDYPHWFIEAIDEGWIINEYQVSMFIDHNGETAMSQGSIILRNFMGNLMYMERSDFDKYYEIIGDEMDV